MVDDSAAVGCLVDPVNVLQRARLLRADQSARTATGGLTMAEKVFRVPGMTSASTPSIAVMAQATQRAGAAMGADGARRDCR
jgi:hypothetical protein